MSVLAGWHKELAEDFRCVVLRLRQGYDSIESRFRAHDTGDVALARQVFGKQYVPWTNARNRPIAYFNFGSPR